MLILSRDLYKQILLTWQKKGCSSATLSVNVLKLIYRFIIFKQVQLSVFYLLAVGFPLIGIKFIYSLHGFVIPCLSDGSPLINSLIAFILSCMALVAFLNESASLPVTSFNCAIILLQSSSLSVN